MTKYNSARNDTKPFSDQCVQLALAATTALTYTIPGTSANAYQATFSWPYNANVWVGYNKTATLPSAGTIAAVSQIELRPDKRYVRGGDVLSFISTAVVTDAGLELLSLPNPN